eukprot:SAG31_NODE_1063_length_10105_cov_4.370778_8_plen_145_part_00
MQKLGVRVSCQEAMEMLWEADEDRAGQALAAQDLVDLYFRVATDTSGYEPRRRVPMISCSSCSSSRFCAIDMTLSYMSCVVCCCCAEAGCSIWSSSFCFLPLLHQVRVVDHSNHRSVRHQLRQGSSHSQVHRRWLAKVLAEPKY